MDELVGRAPLTAIAQHLVSNNTPKSKGLLLKVVNAIIYSMPYVHLSMSDGDKTSSSVTRSKKNAGPTVATNPKLEAREKVRRARERVSIIFFYINVDRRGDHGSTHTALLQLLQRELHRLEA
jgi:hypothetical protein